MIETLHILVFALHLMCVNVATAGPLVCIWLGWREGRGDALAGKAGRYLAACSLLLFMIGSVLGVFAVAGVWSPAYKHVLLERLGSKVFFGFWELVFSLVCLLLLVLWWKFGSSKSAPQRWGRGLLAVLAATNLMYHFPFLFVIAGQLAAEGNMEGGPIDAAAYRPLMLEGNALARTVHFWIASLAVSGVMLIGYALRIGRAGGEADDVKRVARWGGRIALVPTLLQIPVGLWVTLQLPPEARERLMGGDLIATGLFGLSLLAALALMHQLASVAMGKTDRKRLMMAMSVMLLVVVLMSGALRRATHPATNDEAASAKRDGAVEFPAVRFAVEPAAASIFSKILR